MDHKPVRIISLFYEICKEILVLQGYKQPGTHIAKCYVEPLVRTLGVQDERQFAIES